MNNMSKEVAIEYLKRADITVGTDYKTKTAIALEMGIEALENQKIGQWKESCPVVSDGELWKSWVCSECDYRTMSKSLYCPHCGSRNKDD